VEPEITSTIDITPENPNFWFPGNG
jgi:hypothetical protein